MKQETNDRGNNSGEKNKKKNKKKKKENLKSEAPRSGAAEVTFTFTGYKLSLLAGPIHPPASVPLSKPGLGPCLT